MLRWSRARETLSLEGEVDLSNVDELCELLDSERLRGGDVTLDLAALTFIDLAGMRALHRTALALGRDRHTLTLLSPSPLLAEVLAELELDAPTSMRIRRGGPPPGGGARPRSGSRADAPAVDRRPLVTRVARLLAARDGHGPIRPARAR